MENFFLFFFTPIKKTIKLEHISLLVDNGLNNFKTNTVLTPI